MRMRVVKAGSKGGVVINVCGGGGRYRNGRMGSGGKNRQVRQQQGRVCVRPVRWAGCKGR